ncbi:MAG: DUF5118 domain-containing protein, partial [Sphingomonadales bacterium]
LNPLLFMLRSTLLASLIIYSAVALAQQPPSPTPPAAAARPGADSTRRGPGGAPPATGPKAYKDVITTKAVTTKGLFWVHKVLQQQRVAWAKEAVVPVQQRYK